MNYCRFCGKVRYPTYWSAYRVLRKMMASDHHNKGSCYRCQACHDWHLTHFSQEEQVFVNRDKQAKLKRKKMKRHFRNYRKKLRREKRELAHTYYFPPITMNIRPLQKGTDIHQLQESLSELFGLLKFATGAYYGVALSVMCDATYQLRQTGLCSFRKKQFLSRAEESVARFERNLTHPMPDDLELFNPAIFSEKHRRWYKPDITPDEYLGLWKGFGYAVYGEYRNYVTALNYKFERYLNRIGIKEYKTVALVGTTLTLLEEMFKVYKLTVTQQSDRVPLLNVSMRKLFWQMDPTPMIDAWRNLYLMLRGPEEPNDIEANDIKLATDTINDYLQDPYIMMGIEERTVLDYAEVFAGDDIHNEIVSFYADIKEEIGKEMLKYRANERKPA